MKKLAIIVDGASKGNGQYCGVGAVVLDKETGEILLEKGMYVGLGTNNFAEYKAVQFGIEIAGQIIKGGIDGTRYAIEQVLILSDSNLIVNQLRGDFKIKNKELAVFHRETIELLERELDGVEVIFDQIGRDFVERADELAREAAFEGSVQGTKEKYPFLVNLKKKEEMPQFKGTQEQLNKLTIRKQ